MMYYVSADNIYKFTKLPPDAIIRRWKTGLGLENWLRSVQILNTESAYTPPPPHFTAYYSPLAGTGVATAGW